MDDNKGNFKPISEEKYVAQIELENPQVFKVGEVLEVRGSRLRVHKIYRNKITFKLLPKLQ